ncbi:hypothetical protein JCM10207_009239 [Rhodosporidiobolus poonsookiae]
MPDSAESPSDALRSSPWSPLPTPSPNSLRLSAALTLQRQLLERLEQAQVDLKARRRVRALRAERKEGKRPTSSERREKQDRVDELNELVERQRNRKVLRTRAVEALDSSRLVTAHLHAQSSSAAPTQRQAALQAVLAERDTLTLRLLRLQTANYDAHVARLEKRKRRLALHRQNCAMTAELTAIRQPPEELVKTLPQEVQDHYEEVRHDLQVSLSRVAVISQVFQLLVVESGVQWFDPASFPRPASNDEEDPLVALLRSVTLLGASASVTAGAEESAEDANADPEDGESMSPARLLRLLLLAGEPTALAAPGDDAGLEKGQAMPPAAEGVMRAWRKDEEGRKREEKKERIGRTRTV